MSHPFNTSLRRDPEDPRSLLERINAQVGERLEEAVDFFCLDLLVKSRQAQGRPLPEEKNEKDRQEFQQLVLEFLAFLREGFSARLGNEDSASLRAVEEKASGKPGQRLVAVQAHLARVLPDYWQAFDELTARFTQERLAAPPPTPGFLSRLIGRSLKRAGSRGTV
jgi:hypothetical protein